MSAVLVVSHHYPVQVVYANMFFYEHISSAWTSVTSGGRVDFFVEVPQENASIREGSSAKAPTATRT